MNKMFLISISVKMMFSHQKVVILFLVSILHRNNVAESQKVVIVGAGISGYSAGVKLLENGIEDFIILEAENRIGGRIHSVPIGDGKFIDFGAQWVHGQKGNTIYELMKDKFDFGSLKYNGIEMNFLVSNGTQVERADVLDLIKISWKIYDDYEGMGKFNGSFGDFFNAEFELASQDPKFKSIPVETKNQIIDLTHRAVNHFYASANWYDISTQLTHAMSGETEGDQSLTWRTEGFKTVFDFISKKRPDPSKHVNIDNKIKLNKEVVNIEWNTNLTAENKILITCGDYTIYSADFVIFTASLGVLKARHHDLFKPKLPADKVSSIMNSGYGTLDKIFLEFDEPFWPQENFICYNFLWNEADLEMINKSDKSWLSDILGFFKIDGFPNFFEGFVSGEKVHMFESITDEKLTQDVMWLLEKFLNRKLSQPKKIYRTRWESSPNFYGSYSYFSVRAEKSKSSPEILKAPLKDDGGISRVFFAGEATSSDFSGYTNGAMTSGLEIGQKLADIIKK